MAAEREVKVRLVVDTTEYRKLMDETRAFFDSPEVRSKLKRKSWLADFKARFLALIRVQR